MVNDVFRSNFVVVLLENIKVYSVPRKFAANYTVTLLTVVCTIPTISNWLYVTMCLILQNTFVVSRYGTRQCFNDVFISEHDLQIQQKHKTKSTHHLQFK